MQNHKPDIPGILSHLPLFQQLEPAQIALVADATREQRLQKGEMLFQKGDVPRGFYFVVYGQIKLAFPSAHGNEKVIDIIGARQSFGEAVMFMDSPYPVFAESLTDTLLLHISSDSIFDLLNRDTRFARAMLAGMSIRLHSLVQDVESYSLRSSTQRVIGYLLQQCPNVDDSADQTDCKVEIELPTSKHVIASRLNLTPETLSRIFHDLSNAGLLNVHGKHIEISSQRRLREYQG